MEDLERFVQAACAGFVAAWAVKILGIRIRRHLYLRKLRAEAEQREQARHWSGEIDGQQT